MGQLQGKWTANSMMWKVVLNEQCPTGGRHDLSCHDDTNAMKHRPQKPLLHWKTNWLFHTRWHILTSGVLHGDKWQRLSAHRTSEQTIVLRNAGYNPCPYPFQCGRALQRHVINLYIISTGWCPLKTPNWQLHCTSEIYPVYNVNQCCHISKAD